jgi:hypothetical protein
MNISMSKVSKLVAVALVFALMHVSARALAGPAANMQGRLVTSGDRNVTVSGVNAKTGDTIFSGQTLQTPAGTGASVQVASFGRVDFAPNSAGTLTFAEGRLGVALSSGCVLVSSEKGVTATVNARGVSETSRREGEAVDVCLSVNSEDAPVAGVGAAANAGAGAQGPPNPAPPPVATGGGLSNAAAILLTAGIVTAFAVIAHELISDSENPGASGCTPGPNNPSNNTPFTCT